MEWWHSCLYAERCSHAGTIHSFEKPYITRRVKITDYRLGFFFPPQYVHESTTGKTDIFLPVWKARGFSTPWRGKKNQTKNQTKRVSALNFTASTSPARNNRLERKEISNPNDSSLPLLTIYFIFLHQMLWKRNSNVLWLRPEKGRPKCPSCRVAETNSLATPITHTFVRSPNSDAP